MKISVIVPVYNVESYIEKCLNSLINQTLKEIEVIVVNDGSPDNSQKIIDKFVKKYPQKIKSFIKENGGQGSARNYGLKYAHGEYIAYVDSDDYIENNMLEKLYNNAKDNNSDVVICGNKVLSTSYKIINNEPAIIYNDLMLDILFGKMAVWNKIYKKNILTKNNIFFRSNVWYEDIDFTIKILLDNVRVSFVNESLYNYILRPGSTMNNSNIDRNLEILDAFDEMIKYFKNKNEYKHVYNEIEMLAIYHIYIATITRVINAKTDRKNKQIIINKLKNYMNYNFKDFQHNKYIKYLGNNKKIIYYLIKFNLYYIINMIFKIKK